MPVMSEDVTGIGASLSAHPPSTRMKQCRKGHRYRVTEDTTDKTRGYAQCPICKEAREGRRPLRRSTTTQKSTATRSKAARMDRKTAVSDRATDGAAVYDEGARGTRSDRHRRRRNER